MAQDGIHRQSFGKSYRAFPHAPTAYAARTGNPDAPHEDPGKAPLSGIFGTELPPDMAGAPGAAGAREAGKDASPPARLRRMKIALAACGAAVTVALGAAIALLLTEGSPPLRLSGHPSAYQSPSQATHTAASPPAGRLAAVAGAAPRPDSSGSSGVPAGAAGAGAACPLPGGADACPAMVTVPGGSYRIGARRGDPDAQAEELGGAARPIAAFDMSAYEITAGQWQRCVDDGACPLPGQAAASATLPVTGISWDAANGYAAWLSKKTGEHYRLPSEAEWEYAARAGAATVFPWGDQLGLRHAHCGQCGTLGDYPRLAPVGSYPPQRGLYDMVGNAYEWVADCWTANHAQPVPPVHAACRDKVQKGGAYDTLEADVRPVARTHGDRTVGDPRVGFRVARDIRPSLSTTQTAHLP
jgi:formylglycine-generating enzyme required for sulfatase activity